jgi:hypothetical protein
MIAGMDLSRLSALTPQPAAAQPTRDVTAAQRAFFRAALGQAVEPAPAVSPAAPTAPALTASPAPMTPDPERPLRPGSIIDIRV